MGRSLCSHTHTHTHSPLLLGCAACWGQGLHTVCADECRSGHTLCGPVPMGTAVIANSLFLCFLAMLPLLECWQALGRSDMQKRCQVGLLQKKKNNNKIVFPLTLSCLLLHPCWDIRAHSFSVFQPISEQADQMALRFPSSLRATSWQAQLVLGGSQSSGGSSDPF